MEVVMVGVMVVGVSKLGRVVLYYIKCSTLSDVAKLFVNL